jgi:hypothetical protein
VVTAAGILGARRGVAVSGPAPIVGETGDPRVTAVDALLAAARRPALWYIWRMANDDLAARADGAFMGSPEVVAPDTLRASVPRFAIEIVAWVAAPWALAGHSVLLAVLSDVLLIGLPTVFGMPGAKKQRTAVKLTAVPALALELLQPVAAVTAAWFAWPAWVAAVVTSGAMLACACQVPRWRWMARSGPAQLEAC